VSDLIETVRQEILVERAAPAQDILEAVTERIDIIEAAGQGVPGPRGLQGEQGPPGGTLQQYPAGAILSGHRVVTLDSNGDLKYATCTDAAHAGRVIGITTHAADAGAPCSVQTFSTMNESSWSWTPDQPVFLGADGALVSAPPPDAAFVMVVGFAISPTVLFISLREPILLTD
jgi:hypothetical protein